jgi:cyclopropane-fatty-acyl-phospholipid synthase
VSRDAVRGIAESLTGSAVALAEEGRLPDPMISAGIRWLLRSRLRAEAAADGGEPIRPPDDAEAKIAVETVAANQQHYEVPAAFFELVLGSHLKYSCCQWDDDVATLDGAERRMLERTTERAGIGPGQDVLDLGCGWGSFSLHAAAAWPDSRFLAVSNSHGQVDFIRRRARERGIENLEARVADVNEFSPERRFDRIVSVEMMEHVRNHPELFARIATWLQPGGRVFVHVFCHRRHAYRFEARGNGDWMARQFFTGGVMPSEDTIPLAANPHFRLEESWRVSGTHYARTADAWLANLDERRDVARAALAGGGEADPELALRRWRLFFLAVRETFGFAGGDEWGVAHYRLRPGGEA